MSNFLDTLASGAAAYGTFRATLGLWIGAILAILGSAFGLFLLLKPVEPRLETEATVESAECSALATTPPPKPSGTSAAPPPPSYSCRQVVTFTGFNGQAYRGNVTEIVPTQRKASDRIRVNYEAADPAGTVRPGSPGSPRILGGALLGISILIFLIAWGNWALVSRFGAYRTVYGGASAIADARALLGR